jgi:hypothetical protein
MRDEGSQLLEELMRFKPDGMTANAWAVQAGVGRTIWADLRRHGNPSRRTLEKLLSVAGSSLAEFEALRVGAPPRIAAPSAGLAERGQAWRQAPLPPLPLFQSMQRGFWGDPDRGIGLMTIDRDMMADRLPRPTSLAAEHDAYAVTIVSASMLPRFRPGRQVAVSPSSPLGLGDDVLVTLADDQGALIGELQRQTAEAIGLRQFNPPVGFELLADEFVAVHTIMGELI